jgi:BirA family biotin operon repressor/biotin-[acetyl-CoA-carboxylase] ligase
MNDQPQFNARQLEEALATRRLLRVGRCVRCVGEVPSTNDIAWQAASEAGCDGLVILAESQTAGRGRQGRRWHSLPGENLLMSVLLRATSPLLPHEAISLAAGLAIAEGVSRAHPTIQPKLKWPNDVLIGPRKLAGVLVEKRSPGGIEFLVVGMGVNVHAAPRDEQVDRPATCLDAELGQRGSCETLACEILARLDAWVHAIAEGQISELQNAWNRSCRKTE